MRFSFTSGAENPAATKAALAMETGGLVMEGFRRVDEWRQIKGSFDFDEVLYRDTVAIETPAALAISRMVARGLPLVPVELMA